MDSTLLTQGFLIGFSVSLAALLGALAIAIGGRLLIKKCAKSRREKRRSKDTHKG